MKVFIVSQEWACEDGTTGQSTEVFKTEEKGLLNAGFISFLKEVHSDGFMSLLSVPWAA